MTPWWLPDDSLMTPWWLPDDYLMTPWWLPVDSVIIPLMTRRWLYIWHYKYAPLRQSHDKEVAQGGVSRRAIHNWLWIFSLFCQKKFKKFNRYYAPFLCGRHNAFKKNLTFFLPTRTWKNPASKVAYNRPKFFFSTGLKSAQISYSVL